MNIEECPNITADDDGGDDDDDDDDDGTMLVVDYWSERVWSESIENV